MAPRFARALPALIAAGSFFLSACSNNVSSPAVPISTPTTTPTSAPTAAPTTAANTTTTSISNSSVVAFPASNGYSGSITFPSSGVPSGEALTLTTSTTAPANAPASFAYTSAKSRRVEATSTATLIPPYIVASFATSLTIPGIPAVSITLPAPPPSQYTYVIGLFDITSSPQLSAAIAGTVSGSTITFGPYNSPIAFVAGHTYFIGLYAVSTPAATPTPTPSPTTAPTTAPTQTPTMSPTQAPTTAPTQTPTTSPTQAPTQAPTSTPTMAPTQTPYATATTPIVAAGGTLSLPSYGGFSGTLGYPSNNSSGVSAVLTSSTSDLGGTLPSPGANGKFWEQLQLSGSGSVTFNSGTATGTIVSNSLSSANTYTLYAYIPAYYGNSPIATQQLGNPSNGTLSFASPINNITIPTGVNVVLVIAQN